MAWDRRTVEEARIARYGAPGLAAARARSRAVHARPRHAPDPRRQHRPRRRGVARDRDVRAARARDRSGRALAARVRGLPAGGRAVPERRRRRPPRARSSATGRPRSPTDCSRASTRSAASSRPRRATTSSRASAPPPRRSTRRWTSTRRPRSCSRRSATTSARARCSGPRASCCARARPTRAPTTYDSAIECFERAGDVTRWIEALSKHGQHLQAAQVALERGDRALAIQCLHRIAVSDADYATAVMLPRRRLSEGGPPRSRRAQARRAARDAPGRRRARARRSTGSRCCCEQTRHFERALSLLERLRARDATWPHVATRVEALRKALLAQTTNPDLDARNAGRRTDSTRAFRYEILEEIGRGGMGVVFRARDRRLGREVALKRLPDHIRNHPKAIELFLREARAAAALNHPNIVTLFDAGAGGRHALHHDGAPARQPAAEGAAREGAPVAAARSRRSAGRSRRGSSTRTSRASSTATSRPRTSSSPTRRW